MDEKIFKRFAGLRIVFGFVWLVDAWLKWQPDFQNNFAGNFSAVTGIPTLLGAWIHILGGIILINPHFFAVLIAIAETCIALGLIFGFMTRIVIIGGAILSALIWSSVEMFGMFWAAGATDLGTSIGYILAFAALWFGESWRCWSLDNKFFNSTPSSY